MVGAMDATMRARWGLDPALSFLNHGSFGACPLEVLQVQSELRARMERQPVQFFVRDLPGLLDEARAALGRFLHAAPAGLAFVPNATAAVNAVLRWLPLDAGDELLTTDHAYNACRNVLDAAAARAGARVVVARLPFPIHREDEPVESLLAALTPRTRLCLLDLVTSPTALVLPVARVVAALRERGVDTLVDAAHGPGQVPLDVDALGAAWVTGNCHKWLFAPKGAAFLAVREDKRATTRPAILSHGANAPAHARSRLHLEFDWTGTIDPTPWLAVPAGIAFGEGLLPGGWPALMSRNHALAQQARALLCEVLGVAEPAPASMLGAMAAVPLPDGDGAPRPPLTLDPLQERLLREHGVEVPVVSWPRSPKRLVRISAQAYNSLEDYERLAAALVAELPLSAGSTSGTLRPGS